MEQEAATLNTPREALEALATHGIFNKHYTSAVNYICDLPNIGALLVSVRREEGITQVMVKSVLGWLIYTYYDSTVGSNCSLHPILISLYRYFADVVDGWNVTFKSRKSTYFDFFNLFGFGSFYPIKTDVDIQSKDKDMYDYTKTRLLCRIDDYLLPNIINRFVQISFFEVEEIEKFIFGDSITVRISKELLIRHFPDEIKPDENQKKTNENLSVTSFNISEQELSKLAIKKATGSVQIAIKEFMVTEAEYFSLIDKMYHSTVLRIKQTPEISDFVFLESFEEFEKIYRIEKAFVKDLFDCMKIVKWSEISHLGDLRHSETFNFFNLLQDGEESAYSDEKLIRIFYDTLTKNSEGWKNYVHFFLSYDLVLAKIKEYSRKYNLFDIQEITDGFNHILQRLTRYPILIKNVLEKYSSDCKGHKNLKVLYLQLIKFIHSIEDLREQEDNYRILYKINTIFNVGINTEGQRFVDQLDCQDDKGDSYTFITLSNMTILARREGDPLPFLVSKAKYTKLEVFANQDISFHQRGGLGLYLLVNHPIVDSKFSETYKDASLAVRFFISYNECLRERFVKNFKTANSFLKIGNLIFSESSGEFITEIFSDQRCEQKEIYEIQEDYSVVQDASYDVDLLSHLYNLENGKVIVFKDDEIYLKTDRIVFLISCGESLHTLCELIRLANRKYLEIEKKIELTRHLCGNNQKPFKSNTGTIDFKSFVGHVEMESFPVRIFYSGKIKSEISLRDLAQVLEPLQFLKQKFISQEIIEINSDRRLTEFQEADLYSNLIEYVPKKVEELIQKIVDCENYSKLADSIFKSKGDVHDLILNYLSTNIYCFFTEDDLSIIKRFITLGEDVSLSPLISNRSFLKLLIGYLQYLSTLDRTPSIDNFFKRVFSHFNIPQESMKRIIS